MNTSGEIRYALRQVRYWLGRVERLTASDAERSEETEEESSPHTPLKGEGKEVKKESPHRVRVREDVTDRLFDRFWQAYPGPRKTDKKRCRQKFAAILASGGDPEAMLERMLAGIARWRSSRDWAEDGGAYVCAPLVWLNNERWNAEVEPAAPRTAQETPYEREQEEIRRRHERNMAAMRRIMEGGAA